jgi:hypothetical protein
MAPLASCERIDATSASSAGVRSEGMLIEDESVDCADASEEVIPLRDDDTCNSFYW